MRFVNKNLLRMSILAAVSATMIGGLSGAGHAAAATSSVSFNNTSKQITYIGSADRNTVQIFLFAGKVRIVDSVAVVAGAGCQATASPLVVDCPSSTLRLGADLGAGNDSMKVSVPLTGTVSGGAGDDIFFAGTATGISKITYSGGANGGSLGDALSYAQSTAKVNVSLTQAADDGRVGDQDNVGNDIERVTGSRFDDTLTGNTLNNRLEGGPGRDTLKGFGGTDLLIADDLTADAVIDCGEGGPTDDDRAIVSSGDSRQVVLDCERITQRN